MCDLKAIVADFLYGSWWTHKIPIAASTSHPLLSSPQPHSYNAKSTGLPGLGLAASTSIKACMPMRPGLHPVQWVALHNVWPCHFSGRCGPFAVYVTSIMRRAQNHSRLTHQTLHMGLLHGVWGLEVCLLNFLCYSSHTCHRSCIIMTFQWLYTCYRRCT